MILINPPIIKPSEPPAGIAKLSGTLFANNIKHLLLDASIEGVYYLLNNSPEPADTWTRRAVRNLSKNLVALKNMEIYGNIDRYKRTAIDVNRALGYAAADRGTQVSLADYLHPVLSPVNKSNLIYAASHPEENPFYPYFAARLSDLIEGEGITVAGFSLNYLSQALTAFAMVGFLKREYPQVTVILGGGLTTSWMRNPEWKNPFIGLIDYCIAGPGELPLLEILGRKALRKAHYCPSYNLLPVKDYLSPGMVLPYSTSTGCWWGKCSFCPERAEGNRYTQIRPDTVIDDLDSLVKHHDPVLIHLTDNAISPAILNKIAETPLNAAWYGFTRITPHLADLEFCKALKHCHLCISSLRNARRNPC